mgnify:CR=1 FL=1
MDLSRIQVCVPTRGLVDWNVIVRLNMIRDANPTLPPIHYEAGRLAVTDTRNRIAHKFLASDAHVLLMVDDDVIPPLGILTMLEHDKDIVGAPYPIIRAGGFQGQPGFPIPFPCALEYDAARDTYRTLSDPFGRSGLVKVDAIGTGCMAIARRVLEHPDLKIPFRIGTDEYGQMRMSEDVNFCQLAREAGFSVWADFDQRPDHFVAGVSLNRIHDGYTMVFATAAKRKEEGKLVILA